MTLTALAPSKVNLYLHITGKRRDGYHLLESLVAFTEVSDRVDVEKADTLSLHIQGPLASQLGSEEDNLVWKAACRLAESAAMTPRARITLHKSIPIGAGLGGGSADAAATLTLLCRLWNIAPSSETLQAIALSLGADVPVMLAGTPSFMAGIGERVQPLACTVSLPAVLVKPAVSLATVDVYRKGVAAYAKAEGQPPFPTQGTVSAWADFLAARHNALEPPAFSLQPEIRSVLEAIRQQPACLLARMSGSGTACFGLFPDDSSALRAAGALQRTHPGWWVVATRIGNIRPPHD